jgi:hypothetical protein
MKATRHKIYRIHKIFKNVFHFIFRMKKYIIALIPIKN